MDEKKYMETLLAEGVDLPELEEKTVEPEEPEKKPTPPEKDEEKEPEEPVKDPNIEPKKRSIYDEYKDKKSELKSEKERREQIEEENAELKSKLDALVAEKGKDPDAESDALAYAESIGADKDLVARIIADARKGFKSESIDEGTKKDLQDFKDWKVKNQQVIEKTAFEEEFKQSLPSIKELFPTANTEELDAIKESIDKLSHTRDYFDKSLDYVAFKNKQTLSALVSPHKKGMESRERKDVEETKDYTFDPNADYLSMSPNQREKWEAEYNKLGKSDSLMVGANGKKFMV